MNTTRRTARDETDELPQHVVVIGGNRFGLAVAEYLTETIRSVTFVSEYQPSTVADGIEAIHLHIADASDVRALASTVSDVDLVLAVGSDQQALLTGHLVQREFGPCAVVAGLSDPSIDSAFQRTDIDRIDVPRLLAEQIRDRYT